MKNLWETDASPAEATGDLGRRLYASHLIGREPQLLLQAGGSASVKSMQANIFGEQEEVLHITAARADLSALQVEDFVPVRLEHMRRLARLNDLSDQGLLDQLALGLLAPQAPLPSPDALWHAALPHRYVDHVLAGPVLAIACTRHGEQRLRELYGDSVLLVPYARSGWPLAHLLQTQVLLELPEQISGLVLMGHGVVSFGDSARVTYERLCDMVNRAQGYLKERDAWRVYVPGVAVPCAPACREVAALRHAVSSAAGAPVILKMNRDPECRAFVRRQDLRTLAQAGLPSPEQAIWTHQFPLLGRDVASYGVQPGVVDPAPRLILDPELGVCAAGHTPRQAAVIQQICRRNIEIMAQASALGGYQGWTGEEVFAAEHSPLSRLRVAEAEMRLPFSGEVALVTGAASGIGKACAESLLARGAAVVGLDINPAIAEVAGGDGYLGLQCDVTDENAVRVALEQAVLAFGGLDMLVLNAGVFPAGCPIASLDLAEWQRVMRVNLDAGLIVMRECYPLLKLAPRNGRVLVNGSRNVLAPGPGAAAYSASKAALAQLARVAALEWGKDRIRVNMIHPHAVFDTGIWTEEVLQARAAHYGLTVEQYKTNNVLHVEVTSHDVGELVAEMCGPLFAKSTGAQVSVDGGSERVI